MKRNEISVEIDRIIKIMSKLDPSDEKYTKAAKNLLDLCEARNKQVRHIQIETIAGFVISFIEIVLIIKHEEFNVITSKALNRVWK